MGSNWATDSLIKNPRRRSRVLHVDVPLKPTILLIDGSRHPQTRRRIPEECEANVRMIALNAEFRPAFDFRRHIEDETSKDYCDEWKWKDGKWKRIIPHAKKHPGNEDQEDGS